MIYLETLKPNDTAHVEIQVKVDGESQSNAYQDTLARLKVRFAVELPSTDQKIRRVPYTSDSNNMNLWYLVSAASGLIILVVLYIRLKNRDEEEAE